jgi:Tfp pilus assembly protein PilN
MAVTHEINLLPLPLRLKRRYRIYFERLRHLVRRVYLLLIVIVFAQAAMLVFFNATLSAAVEDTSEESTRSRAVQLEVEELNELLAAFSGRVDETAGWTAPLADVLALIPPQITITEISTAAAPSRLEIRGVSTARSAVVTLQEDLEQLPWVARVEVPLENFRVGPTADFNLTVERE